jgi:hypothetical protein
MPDGKKNVSWYLETGARKLLPMRLVLLLAFLLGSPAGSLFAQQVSPLAPAPDWAELEQFQETITREEFTRLLDRIYAPGGAAKDYVAIKADAAVIKTSRKPAAELTLRFAAPGSEKRAAQPWRAASTLDPAPAGKPLQGVKIALDPGHLGGEWARIEERFFQLGESKPVQEGDLTLRVAKLMVPRLEQLGADVALVRADLDPVTPLRPESLRPQARAQLAQQGIARPRETYSGADDPRRGGTVQLESELLFYRMSEIRHRATLVNEKLRPDLTVCLHFNAEAWGDPRRPELVPRNHLHLLVNGCYSAGELKYDDVRFEMLHRLLSRCFPEERAVSESVAAALAKASGLPSYTYTTPNAVRLEGSEFVWARNLLANRLYRTPVIFLEPYVMNSELVWARVQLGDYEGEITIGGAPRKSIFREYADGVVEGLKAYYSTARPGAKAESGPGL